MLIEELVIASLGGRLLVFAVTSLLVFSCSFTVSQRHRASNTNTRCSAFLLSYFTCIRKTHLQFIHALLVFPQEFTLHDLTVSTSHHSYNTDSLTGLWSARSV